MWPLSIAVSLTLLLTGSVAAVAQTGTFNGTGAPGGIGPSGAGAGAGGAGAGAAGPSAAGGTASGSTGRGAVRPASGTLGSCSLADDLDQVPLTLGCP